MLPQFYLADENNFQVKLEHVSMASFLPICDERLTQIFNTRMVLYSKVKEFSFYPATSDFKCIIPSLHQTKECISICEACCKFMTEQPKEPVMLHDLPDCSWQKVAIDLFEFNNFDYLVTVDYFSNVWDTHTGPCLALLVFWCTPIQGMESSLAQQILNSYNCSLLPLSSNLLKSRFCCVMVRMTASYSNADRKSKQTTCSHLKQDLPALNNGDIRICPYKKWLCVGERCYKQYVKIVGATTSDGGAWPKISTATHSDDTLVLMRSTQVP